MSRGNTTGEWIEIFPDLTLDECLAAVSIRRPAHLAILARVAGHDHARDRGHKAFTGRLLEYLHPMNAVGTPSWA